MAKKRSRRRARKSHRKMRCRNVCTFKIPILGICLAHKRKCSRKGRRKSRR